MQKIVKKRFAARYQISGQGKDNHKINFVGLTKIEYTTLIYCLYITIQEV